MRDKDSSTYDRYYSEGREPPSERGQRLPVVADPHIRSKLTKYSTKFSSTKREKRFLNTVTLNYPPIIASKWILFERRDLKFWLSFYHMKENLKIFCQNVISQLKRIKDKALDTICNNFCYQFTPNLPFWSKNLYFLRGLHKIYLFWKRRCTKPSQPFII